MSSNQSISLFNFRESEIRVVLDEYGEPWFVAADVCRALEIQNVTQAVQQLDDDERAIQNIGFNGPGLNIVSESGLYALIIRSNKPQAKPFRKWITAEVLPSLRKTGQYTLLRDALLRPEPTEWERRFPPEFYEAIYPLLGKGQRYKPGQHGQPPRLVGKITRDWVYDIIAPAEILEEAKSRQKYEKLHQWLTKNAVEALNRQITAVIHIARSSADYKDFSIRCSTVFQKQNQQLGIVFPRIAA